MPEENIQELFLRAHLALHPEGASIRELLESEVSRSRVLTLYPYDLAEWAPTLIQSLAGAAAGGNLTAQLRGVEESMRWLPARTSHAWRAEQHSRTAAFLSGTQVGESLMDVLSGTSWIHSETVIAASEMIATAARWDQLTELHPYTHAYRSLVSGALGVLLPESFSSSQ